MLPVHVLAALGIKTLIVTNAAGGLNPDFSIGDVMLIDDHLNLMSAREGGAEDGGQWASTALSEVQGASEFGRATCHGRFYDLGLATAAEAIARREDFPLRRGVYVGVTGPSYETRAEYRAFRRIGGDAVGMSTIPEVLAAAGCGLCILGLSTITNVARPDAPQVVSAAEVVAIAELALPRVRAIIRGLLTQLPRHGPSG
jgi:purine-nucleoside phosphorylase